MGTSAAADSPLTELASQVLGLAAQAGVKLAVAESLTGGLLASTLVAVPGASKVFLGGVVAYTNDVKHELLGVDADTLARSGAVSSETALAMAEGVAVRFSAAAVGHVIGVSTTGVAGPDSQDGKPVGCVFIGVAGFHGTRAIERHITGDRTQVRDGAVLAAMTLLRDELLSHLGL